MTTDGLSLPISLNPSRHLQLHLLHRSSDHHRYICFVMFILDSSLYKVPNVFVDLIFALKTLNFDTCSLLLMFTAIQRF
ncbi:hypothetical protein Hanom_Chr06g00565891 [Helianthus anomalus]